MSESAITAFVLVKVPANGSGRLVERVWETIPEVKEAAAVYGDYDVILQVEANDLDHFHDIVMERIQKMEFVTYTRTFLVIPQLHRRR